jgi:SAM-dependent methyltransferase
MHATQLASNDARMVSRSPVLSSRVFELARGDMMDLWKFYAVTHARHLICNPLSEQKLDEIIELLALPASARVLDIACGKGEFLRRTALRWACTGVGVDISPFFVADARENMRAAALQPRVDIIEANAKDFAPAAHTFDVSVCFGASWIWNGFAGTLKALGSFTRPNGVVVVGEPFWRRPPSSEYLEAMNIPRDAYGTHKSNVVTGESLGFALLHSIVSNQDDWDRYEGYQWFGTEQYARQNPGDADAVEILARTRADRDQYLKWGRDELGWAVYLFAAPSETMTAEQPPGPTH